MFIDVTNVLRRSITRFSLNLFFYLNLKTLRDFQKKSAQTIDVWQILMQGTGFEPAKRLTH